ncbi:histone-like nucleoid-structuring protein Lsr2 [Streptomyces sp. NPDC001832]|uniref:Lsr2 family DNA-binding protein n=1 Tax=Streptomyces sp. NPDC001832 TaxID=3154527 RepID=UPI003319B034
MTNPDPALVREFMVHERLRLPDDMSPLFPAEIRYFQSYYPAYAARLEREAAERALEEEKSRRRRAAAERVAEHTRLMKEMREWGRENGYFVGTRGRIPGKVINAYREAKGL